MTSSDKLEILITSGPIAVGKSSIVNFLISEFGFKKISSGLHLTCLANLENIEPNRENLTRLGDNLDSETDYSWVVDQVTRSALDETPLHSKWIFDSVRKHKQVAHFRNSFPDSIKHVHLTASNKILKTRYNNRIKLGSVKDASAYDLAINHPNEIEARSLLAIADIEIDASTLPPIDLAKQIYESTR